MVMSNNTNSQLSLLDIGPLTETVEIKGKTVTVYGITVDGIFHLMSKFASVRSFITKQQEASEVAVATEVDTLSELGADAVASICAAATIDREECKTFAAWKKRVETDAKVALKLPLDLQLKIIAAAMKLTFSEGVGP